MLNQVVATRLIDAHIGQDLSHGIQLMESWEDLGFLWLTQLFGNWVQLLRAAWVLAEKMESTKELRQCLVDGIVAIGTYLSEDHKEFTPECFEMLSTAIETCRAIMQATGRIERAQAMAAVLDGRVNIKLE